jgi:hypothetical protein
MASKGRFIKVASGVAIAGALTLTSLFGGAVHADGGLGAGELQQTAVSKSMDSTSPGLISMRRPATLAGDFDQDGDVDGRDFLIWQRSPGAQPVGTALKAAN